MALVDNTYSEYLMKHRLNLKNWRIADVDNYMNGNPFFSDYMDENEWEKSVADSFKD